MIPKKLQIKNFLSYGPETQTIDFLSYNLICLSGKNGHGKSALLDAITWALWGQARKTTGTSKADEGLVHLGQKHMLITFDFEINGTAYRVRREFVKTQSTPFSALDFGIVKADDSFTTLTDKTIKATQSKLEKTIGITFESFINSAFLRQGQANEFSKKSPKERKDILATILQLERFEDLKKVALEKTKTFQQQLLQRQSIYDRIQQEIHDLQVTLVEKEKHAEQLELIEKQHAQLEKIVIEHEQKKTELLRTHQTYEIIQIQKKQCEQQLVELEQQIKELEKKIQDIASQQIIITDITDLETEQKRLRALVIIHQEKSNKRLELKEQYLAFQEKKQLLEKELMQEQSERTKKYEIETQILQEQIKQQLYQKAIEEKKIVIAHQEIAKQQAMITDYERTITEQTIILKQYTAHEKQSEEHKNQYQAYKTRAVLLEQQIIDEAKKYRASLDSQDPICPLCQQNLSNEDKKLLEQQFEKNSITMKAELEKIQADTLLLEKILTEEQILLKKYHKDSDELTKLVSKTESMKDQTQKLINQANFDEKQIIAIDKKIYELQKNSLQLQTDQKQAEQNSFNHEKEVAYQTLIKKIDVLKQTGQTLAYDKENHEKDFKQLQEIDKHLQMYHMMQKEIAQQEQRSLQISNLQATHEKMSQSYKILNEQFDKIKNCPTELAEHLKIEHDHKQQLTAISTEKSNLLNKKAILDLQQTKMLSLQNEQQLIKKEITTITAEITDFIEISKALGKDGLQALLIEQALPEIEQQANILLAQLTDNQTQIFIESLRDLKKGGSKETLDIKISDAIGLRPYEMFSGGEAFRIDFALRIAISKLLARRAGTALQTLIIDEGFGSQDDDGLQLIMDSILKIQDNFAKVIIVSHLPSMKEQFPVQFLVQKKASGSTVTVIQQG